MLYSNISKNITAVIDSAFINKLKENKKKETNIITNRDIYFTISLIKLYLYFEYTFFDNYSIINLINSKDLLVISTFRKTTNLTNIVYSRILTILILGREIYIIKNILNRV